MGRIYDDLPFGITPELWDSLIPKLDSKLVIYGTAGEFTAEELVKMKTIFQEINNENNT